MFSAHSFNALLKTLEEPPPHVKFLLATTDPQKVPVTVLSRCLQFHLRQLPAVEIVGHLNVLTDAEAVQAEPAGLALIARAAAGSMRDSLSLLDQAIAHGDGAVLEADVRAMLGVTRQDAVHDIVERIADGDASEVLALIEVLAGESVDFGELLGELLGLLQRMAVAKLVPERDADAIDAERVQSLAERFSAEDIQLLYQIGILGRRDLPFALDARNGVEMTVLRMLAFRPEEGPVGGGVSPTRRASASSAAPDGPTSSAPAATPMSEPAATLPQAPPAPTAFNGLDEAASGAHTSEPSRQTDMPDIPVRAAPAVCALARPEVSASAQPASIASAPLTSVVCDAPVASQREGEVVRSVEPASTQAETAAAPVLDLVPGAWREVIEALGVRGLARELAYNTQLVAERDGLLELRIAPKHAQLRVARAEQTLAQALSEYATRPIKVRIDVGEPNEETPQQVLIREANTAHAQATAAIREDPTVQAICDMFDATVDPDAIQSRPN